MNTLVTKRHILLVKCIHLQLPNVNTKRTWNKWLRWHAFWLCFFGFSFSVCFFRICFFGSAFSLCFFESAARAETFILANWYQKLDAWTEQKSLNIISKLITNELVEYQFLHSQLGLISHNQNWHLRVFKPWGKYASTKALSTIDEYATQDV